MGVIDVVGVGVSVFDDLPAATRDLVLGAEVVVGACRMLADLPEQPGQQRQPWPSPLLDALPVLLADLADRRVVVLASGDPLVSGVGTTLIRLLGPDAVRVHPSVSSVALARARMGWSAESSDMISLVSKPADTVRRWLTPGARLILLAAGTRTPDEVAAALVDAGFGRATLTVLGRLGAPDESRLTRTAEQWDEQSIADVPALNVTCVEIPTDLPAWGAAPGLPDEAFEHDGQLTKWELRIAALAALRPLPGQRLWDLGAGAGSVGIEWARHHPRCSTVAVERDPDRAARIIRNATRLGVPAQVSVVRAAGADALAELPDPDACFIGGGLTTDLLEAVWARLPAGGRLVAHAVTLQAEQVLMDAYARHDGQLRRLSVDRVEPLGKKLTSWTPARPIVHWGVVKESND